MKKNHTKVMYRMEIELRQLHAKPYMWEVYTFRSHLGDCFREKKDTPPTPQLVFENLCLYSCFSLTFFAPLRKLNNTYHKKNPLAWRISSCQIIKRAVKMLKDHLLGSLVTICKGRYSKGTSCPTGHPHQAHMPCFITWL